MININSWVPVVYQNGYRDILSGYEPSQYCKDLNGFVYLKIGACTLSPFNPLHILTLPVGYRPGNDIIFNNQIVIKKSGEVLNICGFPSIIGLNRFLAEEEYDDAVLKSKIETYLYLEKSINKNTFISKAEGRILDKMDELWFELTDEEHKFLDGRK